jgi:hypothetical protein
MEISSISLNAALEKLAITYWTAIHTELSFCNLKELIISEIPPAPKYDLPYIESLELLTLEFEHSWDGTIVGRYKKLQTLTLRGSGSLLRSLRLWNLGSLAVQLRRLNLIGPWHLEDFNLLANVTDSLSVSDIPWLVASVPSDPPTSHLKSIELHDTNAWLLTCFKFKSLEQVLISHRSLLLAANSWSRISADHLKTLIIKNRTPTEKYYPNRCVYDFTRFVELKYFWLEGYLFEPDDLRTFFRRILPFMNLVYLSPQEVQYLAHLSHPPLMGARLHTTLQKECTLFSEDVCSPPQRFQDGPVTMTIWPRI